MMVPILTPVIILAGIGLIMALLLALGRKVFFVEVDERIQRIGDILPGVNCGGCGFPGCSGYAAALISGVAKPAACPPGGVGLAQEIGDILGVEVEDIPDEVALVACAGDHQLAPRRADYVGIQTCIAAHSVAGGTKKCTYGCLGYASCKDACPFDAIIMTEHGLAVVIPERCTGCGQCVPACPRDLLRMVPKSESVQVLCRNPGKTKEVKAVCSVGCTGCQICNKQSPRFKMSGTVAVVDPNTAGDIPKDTSLACPQGSIFDGRLYSITSWTTDSVVRLKHRERSTEWKKADKERKALLRKAKAAKKEKEKSDKKERDDQNPGTKGDAS
ncbi:MAG: RnfABCDGE type electron transport complex subunit B [Proteobacteria bacterium]|nr:RnfABCDGE type electron transport complex subunit B [Pseudomonadota bacterium]